MAIPDNAFVFEEEMDPEDIIDFKAECATASVPMLEVGENIDTFTIVPGPEATALGLEIGTGQYAAGKVDGDQSILFWAQMDSAYWDNPAFEAEGTPLPVELTVVTDSTPPRQRQKTLVIKVAQQ